MNPASINAQHNGGRGLRARIAHAQFNFCIKHFFIVDASTSASSIEMCIITKKYSIVSAVLKVKYNIHRNISSSVKEDTF